MLTHKKLEEYRQAAINLAAAKELEMKLRLEICDDLLKGAAEGTHNIRKHGFKIKAVRKMNYSLDQDLLKLKIDNDELTDDEWHLLRVKYDLRLGEYRKAGDVPHIDEVLVVKDATPGLTIELGE